MQHNEAIFESLFNRNFSDTANTDFLKEITTKHPYFSPAQFFLLQKPNADHDAFKKQVLKTNILFNNPHWLHFQLQQTNNPVEIQQSLPVAEIKLVEPVQEIHEPVSDPIDDLPDNTDETVAMEQEIEPMKIELKMPEQKTNLDEAMLFEPMHLVDYFASQGIKLSDEIQTGDKLGKQLKSFTEWLKTMKKLHVEEVAATVQTDENIPVLAENSNTETEVLTESMAEVFARQGKMAKAGEVYKKLSLLNPAKSTYFAAKIENLKGI